MITIRKYLFLFSSICIGIYILQFMYIIHLHKLDFKTEKIKNDIMYKVHVFNDFQQKFTVDFTVNDILDHMTHLRHGDLVNGNFSAKLPNFMLNKTKQSFKREKLKVIVVPHSHNDPGYKKTYSEYFNESTSNILSLAVEKMFKYHDMSFVWPETCFIEKWWNNQNKTTRKKFKHLVKSGRLELTSGAWVIPDEATPHYFAYLDQMIEGHFWIKRHIGIVPEASFDMDQFSLSSTVRHLMNEAGIKYNVLKRVHLGMKDYFMKKRLMNFYWKGLSGNSSNDGIFIHLEPYEWLSFPDSCGPSRSICEDLDLGHDIDLPVPGSPEADKPIRLLFHRYSSLGSFADKVVRQLKLKSYGYLHDVILLPHGGDFRYDTANEWDRQYRNMKILMQYINSNEKYNVRMDFGTVKEYFSEVKIRSKLHGIQYPTVGGDFVPFARHLHYWSGFFTTRQYLKRLGRQLQESVRAADILTSLLVLSSELSEIRLKSLSSILRGLVSARRELDLFQHHDAITGTSDVYVVKDYEKRLSSALSNTEKIIATLAEFIIYGKCAFCEDTMKFVQKVTVGKESIGLHYRGSDTSHLPVSQQKHVKELEETLPLLTEEATALMLYNPFTQERTEIIRVSLTNPRIVISDPKGVNISVDFLWEREHAKLFFEVKLPPLSLTVWEILKSQKFPPGREMEVKTYDVFQKENIICENNEVNITFSTHDASPINMCYKSDNFCTRLNIHWRHYPHSGGAYTMSSSKESYNVLGKEFEIRKLSGRRLCIVEVSHKLFKVEYVLKNTSGVNGRVVQLNVYSDLSRANSRTFAGEFAVRIDTSIKNGETYYTDSNGFYLARRKFRENLPFASNVYPMTSMAVIKDSSRALTVHSAQPHGVVGWEPGILDIMIDRVAIVEELGLFQKIVDNKPTLTKLFLQFEAYKFSDEGSKLDILKPSYWSLATNDIIQHPVVHFVTTSSLPSKKNTFDFVQTTCPCEMIIANMKCMTNDEFEVDGISLTLHHRLMQSCNKLSNHCGVQNRREYTSLSPFKLFKNVSSKKWKVKEMSLTHLKTKRVLTPGEEVTFKRMEIKTFFFHN